MSIEDLRFIPVSEKIDGINEEDKKYLGLHVCEHLDVDTNKCKIYERRPVECRRFMCKGNPTPRIIQIKGEGIGREN